MPSLISGYEYDIFISYRQKDNKHDGWVSTFVEELKGELESTFKEEISVYFDINPHDGLRETHDVDESLKDKLKCLIFIPIISRTYCDPKSFAWEHEFKVFIKQASQDQFGLKIKLPNGNVASRVLPVIIYGLDSTDNQLYESVVEGVLRGIEFIYKEPGVNRPLKPDDDEKVNLNRTKYRNQINKVANAINEIISGFKLGQSPRVIERTGFADGSGYETEIDMKKGLSGKLKPGLKRIYPVLLIFAVIALIFFVIYPRLFNRDSLEKLRSSGGPISVAVMPFQNLANDTMLNVWQSGIQNELISYLSSSRNELKVRQVESVKSLLDSKGVINYASITPDIAKSISKKLDVNVYISGSIKRAGKILRLNAQLIDPGTEEVFKSFQVDGNPERILNIVDSLSGLVKNALIISRLEKEMSPDYKHILPTNSAEAYRYFIYGENAFNDQDFRTAIKLDSQAFAIDTNFIQAAVKISISYYDLEIFKQAKKWFLRVNRRKDQLPMWEKIVLNRLHAMFYETPAEEIKYHRQLLEFDDQLPKSYYNIGLDYTMLYQFDKAMPELEKVFEVYKKWNIKPSWANYYSQLEYVYYMNGDYNKLEKISREAERDYPDDFYVNGAQVVISLVIEKDTVRALTYLENCKSILRENKLSDSDIESNLGYLFAMVNIPDKSEKYYQQALAHEPQNPDKINDLAYLLINSDLNINKGLELVDKALAKDSDNYKYLGTKGWGLYKNGMYREALELLERSWAKRREEAIYDHEAFLHLEAAKKAVAEQKK